MFHISIALTLLTLMGGVLLLWKVKSDAMGAFAKWVAYFVIVMSFVMLLFDLTHGVMRMMHCDDGHHGMYDAHGINGCPPEMCGGMSCCMPGSGHMGGKMHGGECCDEEKEHGKAMGGHHMEGEEHEGMEADTAKK